MFQMEVINNSKIYINKEIIISSISILWKPTETMENMTTLVPLRIASLNKTKTDDLVFLFLLFSQ